jgi:hypothetical protein
MELNSGLAALSGGPFVDEILCFWAEFEISYHNGAPIFKQLLGKGQANTYCTVNHPPRK